MLDLTNTMLARRRFMQQAAIFPLLLTGTGAGHAVEDEDDKDKRLVRSKEPLNLEMPFDQLGAFQTPKGLHYIRNHYARPKIDLKAWRLEVSGAVDKPLSLTLDD